jgi:putative ABC transport system permease protein
VAKAVFPAEKNVLGQEVKIMMNDGTVHTFSIVGVYKYEEQAGSAARGKQPRTELFVPISTAGTLTSLQKGYQSVTIMASDTVDADQFSAETLRFLNLLYGENNRFELYAYSMEGIMNSNRSMMTSASATVGIVAGISLLVGGIGVMNIMLVSVTERTREIGTRKALGARNAAIRTQFIVEAVFICVVGGLIGILFGCLLGYGASALLMHHPQLPSLPVVIGSVCFAMAIGVFFGYYPANKAAKLDPIEALRYE